MKMKKIPALLMALSLILLTVSGCGKQQSPQMVNELSFALDGIQDITISYDDEDIRFFQSDSDALIVKEYMNQNKDNYHAKVMQDRSSIKISEGEKPLSKDGFVRYIEVYFPAAYQENLKITATDGNIDLSGIDLEVKSLRIDCTSGILKLHKATASDIHLSSTSGKMELETIKAEGIRIDTTKGSVTCKSLEGIVAYTSTGGDAAFLSCKGSGTYRVNNSGKLSVCYEEVTGNLSLYNKNDSIALQLPPALEFEFAATTKNGTVKTDFQGSVSVSGSTTSGTVGNAPSVSVSVETKNGNIEVTR